MSRKKAEKTGLTTAEKKAVLLMLEKTHDLEKIATDLELNVEFVRAYANMTPSKLDVVPEPPRVKPTLTPSQEIVRSRFKKPTAGGTQTVITHDEGLAGMITEINKATPRTPRHEKNIFRGN
jgi:hypothetical protein